MWFINIILIGLMKLQLMTSMTHIAIVNRFTSKCIKIILKVTLDVVNTITSLH